MKLLKGLFASFIMTATFIFFTNSVSAASGQAYIHYYKQTGYADRTPTYTLSQPHLQSMGYSVFGYNDDLVGFLKNTKITKESSEGNKALVSSKEVKEKKLEEYKKLAIEIANNIINKSKTSFNKYDLSKVYYQDSYDEFVYTFTKTIDGYETNDSITISLDINGDLSSFSAPRQGLFDKYENLNIDRKKIDEFVNKSLESDEYKNVSSYNVDYQFINFVNNQLVLEIGIGLKIEDALTTTIFYYEL